MANRSTRRRFLTYAGAASATLLGSSLFDLDTVFAAPYMRRNLGGMPASDPVLVSYRKAIHAMRALPTSNPLSWNYQWSIHATTLSGSYTAWRTCQHHTHFFWSWHRMYLYWFERIIRKMSGDSSFALPFWDYSSPSQRQIPAPFRDTGSELYTSQRAPAMNDGSGSLPAGHVDTSAGMSLVNFFAGQSSLESNPHDNVHVDVGGCCGWMGSIPTAAQDPVFYVHHSNMDRLWNIWLAQGGGRSDPLSDSAWKSTTYTFFDENGKAVNMTACDILRAADQLNYTYEGEPAQVKESCTIFIPIIIYWLEEILIKWPPPVELTGQPVEIVLPIREYRQQLMAVLENKSQTPFLRLENVVAERQPGVVWEVHLGAAAPGAAVAGKEQQHYIGNVALFSTGIRGEGQGHEQFRPATFNFPLREAQREALSSNAAELRLTFVPSGILIKGQPSRPQVQAPARIGSISLVVETEKREENKNPLNQRIERPNIEKR